MKINLDGKKISFIGAIEVYEDETFFEYIIDGVMLRITELEGTKPIGIIHELLNNAMTNRTLACIDLGA